VFAYITRELQENVLELVKVNSEFALGLGYGLGYVFSTHTKAFQKEIFKRAEEDGHFRRGLEIGLGEGFPFLDRDSQLRL
jgi:hypothetical protein